MNIEDFKTKKSVIIVYTGEGKGKTSAALGLMVRALGNRFNVAFIQFIKHWGVSEHVFIRDIRSIYKDQLYFYKGGKGFYKAGDLSEKHISNKDHEKSALDTFKEAIKCAESG
ncbi:MAG TPA: cob(I)yrinic acid a,c-diamide adenosyltransferase, partial [Patescibacteria group bacterium]|nr:cob(I)yrinic acid a,c-diamide adenosyltransferase [Patescibacteria group bacterium]